MAYAAQEIIFWREEERCIAYMEDMSRRVVIVYSRRVEIMEANEESKKLDGMYIVPPWDIPYEIDEKLRATGISVERLESNDLSHRVTGLRKTDMLA